MTEFRLVTEFPGATDYLRLRAITGLSQFSEEAAILGQMGTIFGVSIMRGDDVVGMGRIIGDGGCIFQVVDIAVDPDCQGHGLGKQIVGALTDYIHTSIPEGAYVSLIADLPADALYAQFGFVPTAPASIGMAMKAGKR